MFFSYGILLADENNTVIIYHAFHKDKNTDICNCTAEELTQKVMENGEILIENKTPGEINQYLKQRFNQLPDEHKRFISPHIYKVGISEKLLNLRDSMLKDIREKIK
jgi:nicotinate phosphoribosyltransferase